MSEYILERGQRDGLLGRFEPWVMAVTIQRSLDWSTFLLDMRPDLDLAHYGGELVGTFSWATAGGLTTPTPERAKMIMTIRYDPHPVAA